jgi:hypothetical protein
VDDGADDDSMAKPPKVTRGSPSGDAGKVLLFDAYGVS